MQCENCGYQNPETLTQCQSCDADLLAAGHTLQDVDLYGQTMVDVAVPETEQKFPVAHLTLKSGPFSGRSYPLGLAQTLGREKSEIILRDAQMSRQHAAIKYLEGQFLLIDLGSANHTFINDQMIQAPSVLQNGDSISMGNTVLEFTLSEDEGQEP